MVFMAFPTLEARSISANQLTFALTTLFTPPSDCHLPILTESGSYYNYWIPGSDGGTTTFFGSARSCYPSQFYLTGDLVPLYSPGACPSGFEIVSAATPLDPVKTLATCCPSGATTYSGYFCTADPITRVTTINDGKSTILNGKYIFEYPPMTMAWQPSDLPHFNPPSAALLAYPSGAAPTLSSAASTSHQSPGAAASTTSATRSSTPSPTNSSSGLSTGAKAGIGVGAAVVAMVIMGALVWALLRRRRSKQSQSWPSPPTPGHEGSSTKRPNESDTRWYQHSRPNEVQEQRDKLHEADAVGSPWIRSELSSDNIRAELSSSRD